MDSGFNPARGAGSGQGFAEATPNLLASPSPGQLIGCSPGFNRVLRQVERIAPAGAPVLIQGETGCGKELIARSIHDLSPRRDKAFVPLNCGAVPDALFESELYGHVRGAFTDAKVSRAGLVAQAHLGTLFLDEVDSLSPRAQVSLLRFLQDQRYRPVGSTTEQVCDTRILAACNRPLERVVEEGEFRRDLFYRLNVIALNIPPLRERPDDIDVLAQHFVDRYAQRYFREPLQLTAQTLSWLRRQPWPGNVRELENFAHRLVLMDDGEELMPAAGITAPVVPVQNPAGKLVPDFQSAKRVAIAEFERSYLESVLAKARGNVSEAARMARTERRSFGKLLKKYHIDKSAFRG